MNAINNGVTGTELPLLPDGETLGVGEVTFNIIVSNKPGLPDIYDPNKKPIDEEEEEEEHEEDII